MGGRLDTFIALALLLSLNACSGIQAGGRSSSSRTRPLTTAFSRRVTESLLDIVTDSTDERRARENVDVSMAISRPRLPFDPLPHTMPRVQVIMARLRCDTQNHT